MRQKNKNKENRPELVEAAQRNSMGSPGGIFKKKKIQIKQQYTGVNHPLNKNLGVRQGKSVGYSSRALWACLSFYANHEEAEWKKSKFSN